MMVLLGICWLGSDGSVGFDGSKALWLCWVWIDFVNSVGSYGFVGFFLALWAYLGFALFSLELCWLLYFLS